MSGCVFGSEPAAGAVNDAEDGLVLVAVIGEVFGLASEAEDEADFVADTELVNIAETGDKAAAEAEAVPESKFVAEYGFVVSAYETDRNLSSGVAVAWNSFGVVFLSASEAEYIMAPCKNTRGTPSEALAGAQIGATAVASELLDKPEIVELELFAEGMVGELDVSAGQWLGFVDLVWVSTAGMEIDPVGNLGGNVEVGL